jgi:putative NIF3 family GTP cyclohydrolase 1 type 2
LKDSQQQTLLRLANAGISVYSPHTAVDAAPGGLGDWLADIVTGTKPNHYIDTSSESSVTSPAARKGEEDPFVEKSSSLRPTFKLHHQLSNANLHAASTASPPTNGVGHTRRPIVPQSPALESHPGAGMGRIVTFNESQPLPTLLDRIGKAMNNPKGFPIAIPQNASISDLSIKNVGICAGSGGSLLANLDIDLLFTGEMSHHEALAAIEKGQVVVSLFHSNSERGFLSDVLRGQLEDAVVEEWAKVREEEGGKEHLKEALADENFEVTVSEMDRDPYGILVLNAD